MEQVVKLKVNQWRPYLEGERHVATEARRLFSAYEQARAAALAVPGWMYWKRYSNDREYLVRAYDRTGRGTTLGSRSEVTESQLLQFKSRQLEAKLQLKLARDNLKLHARFAKAARLNRVPRAIAAVLRAVAEVPGTSAAVISAHAFFAYESLADVVLEPWLVESASLELLVAPPNADNDAPDYLAILRSADPTYRLVGDGRDEFVNEIGFIVRISHAHEVSRTDGTSLSALGLDELWASSLSQVVIDQDGMPLEMRVPEPRLYSRWKQAQATRLASAGDERSLDQASAIQALFASAAPVVQLPIEGIQGASATGTAAQ
ncbi:MAG TPA: GSU2403 family nucleotidyltransferase fold protein [Candidatus Binatia bacterium]|jgi:hypothetical protein|nr:GSU2403 family nucleotidyltransferase fold protein [Candidatus Binatia bacterium]